MEYADVIASAFAPSGDGAISRPTMSASRARRFRDAIEPLAMHAVWSRTTNEALAALGLNFFTGYLWGRAAALGEPDPGVVVSSFAVFEPTMLTDGYLLGRASCSRAALLDARTEATVRSLSEALAVPLDDAACRHLADVLQQAVTAAPPVGRPLFSGLLTQPWPDSTLGRIWHACELAREHRGDSHVAVCVERGLDPVEMNILTELWVGYPLGAYTASRGWSPAVVGEAASRLVGRGLLARDSSGDIELSSAGQTFRNEIERATDRLEQPIIDALGDDADQLIEQLATWSQSCIDARSFPPNVFKRAAG